jgi:hypothetical protein
LFFYLLARAAQARTIIAGAVIIAPSVSRRKIVFSAASSSAIRVSAVTALCKYSCARSASSLPASRSLTRQSGTAQLGQFSPGLLRTPFHLFATKLGGVLASKPTSVFAPSVIYIGCVKTNPVRIFGLPVDMAYKPSLKGAIQDVLDLESEVIMTGEKSCQNSLLLKLFF